MEPTVISLALISSEVRQRLITITLDELWLILDDHCSDCAVCDQHTLCSTGQDIVLGIEATMGRDVVAAAA